MNAKQYYTTEAYLKKRIRTIGKQLSFKAEYQEDYFQ